MEAYEELVRASSHPNPDIRTVADVFLDEIREVQARNLIPTDGYFRARKWDLEPAV